MWYISGTLDKVCVGLVVVRVLYIFGTFDKVCVGLVLVGVFFPRKQEKVEWEEEDSGSSWEGERAVGQDWR